MNLLIPIGILLIFLIVAGMAVAIISGNEAERRRRTLAVIRGRSGGELKSSRADDQDKRRAEIAKKLKDKGAGEEKKKASTADLLQQAGLKISARRFWVFSVLFGIFSILIAKSMGASPLVVLLVGVTGLLGLPRMFLKSRIKRRQKKFLEEFADALEAMVRLLRAGMPVTEAIAMAGREFEGPVGEEMTRVYEAQKVGISLPDATLAAARRMPLTEMQMFATGISIQAQTGASLSEVLMNLAGVIRARYRLKRKVQALSSEAKASAGIIGSLPFLVGSGLFFINPDYIGLLLHTRPGQIMMVGGAIWMGLGIFIMKAMINFKV